MAAECDNPYDTRFRPERLLLYDKHPGGIGIAAQVRHSVAAIGCLQAFVPSSFWHVNVEL